MVVGDVGMGVSRANMYRKEISLSMSRSYGPGRYDPDYEESGHDYPIGYVRWTEGRNMEAFLDLLSAGTIQVEPLLEHCYAVEEGAKAYAAVEAGAYTCIIDYHATALTHAKQGLPSGARVPEPQSADKLRVGCIGAGGFARGVVFPLLKTASVVTLASVAASKGGAAEVRTQRLWIRPRRSAVRVTPKIPRWMQSSFSPRHNSHAPYVQQALAQGKAVFVEKPLAVNREQLDAVCEAYETASANQLAPFVMVGFNRRFAPLTQKLAAFFAGRTEPMLVHIRCNAGFIPRDSWIQSPENGGRLIGELCHFIDWARAVVGCP